MLSKSCRGQAYHVTSHTFYSYYNRMNHRAHQVEIKHFVKCNFIPAFSSRIYKNRIGVARVAGAYFAYSLYVYPKIDPNYNISWQFVSIFSSTPTHRMSQNNATLLALLSALSFALLPTTSTAELCPDIQRQINNDESPDYVPLQAYVDAIQDCIDTQTQLPDDLLTAETENFVGFLVEKYPDLPGCALTYDDTPDVLECISGETVAFQQLLTTMYEVLLQPLTPGLPCQASTLREKAIRVDLEEEVKGCEKALPLLKGGPLACG